MSKKLAKVIGYPVAQSLSPKLHNYWLKKYGIDGEYLKEEVLPKNLGDVIKNLDKEGFVGMNITVPHKEETMKHVDEISDLAKKIGAINTVVVKEDKTIFGTNTDGYGFIENVKQTHSDFDFSKGTAVVLGAGGAARSIVVGLLDAGAPGVVITNRTKERAEAIKKHIGGNIQVADWEDRNEILSRANFLVNTTTLGMVGQPELEIDLQKLPHDAIVADVVFKPLITGVLEKAQERGNRIVDGLGMLLYQAVPGFEAWFGKKPEVTDELRNIVLGK